MIFQILGELCSFMFFEKFVHFIFPYFLEELALVCLYHLPSDTCSL